MTAFADEEEFELFGSWSGAGEGAGALVFAVDGEARALMQLRDDRPHVPGPGMWAPFGGGVEAGESLREAAVREFEEETGLALSRRALRPFGRSLLGLKRRSRLYAFVARMPAGPEAVRLGEGAGFALFTPAQLRAVPLSPSLAAMTLRLADLLERGELPEAAGARPPPAREA
ncbi:MAG: NUDIX domain-containing protein [Pseudomonadota bacterium]